MIKSFADLFKVPDLKKRILFTFGILALFRIGVAIPLPGVNPEALRALFELHRHGLLGFLDMFSGGALSQLSIFSLGIMPYINASIIMSLVQGAHLVPYIDMLAREGEAGRRKINQITRYLTILIATVQATGLTIGLNKMTPPGGAPIIENFTIGFLILTVITLVTGTMLVMWLGEQITEFGIGNGVSLIIFAGIVDRLPGSIKNFFQLFRAGELSLFLSLFLIAIVIFVTASVVWVETAQRRIPIQYAQRVVGRKIYSGATTFLPLKVDQAGVIAVIFAISVLSFPLTITQFMPTSKLTETISSFWQRGGALYCLILFCLVIFFCYFYNSIILNPKDLSENLKKWGGFVPGIRPGEATAIYIQRVVERITLGGALFVATIAVMPDLLRSGLNAPFFFGGTALLIAVGVALDTVSQTESHLIMRHYESFFKQAKIKGRWFNIR
jgi:preprotein translocase subunit SecY